MIPTNCRAIKPKKKNVGIYVQNLKIDWLTVKVKKCCFKDEHQISYIENAIRIKKLIVKSETISQIP